MLGSGEHLIMVFDQGDIPRLLCGGLLKFQQGPAEPTGHDGPHVDAPQSWRGVIHRNLQQEGVERVEGTPSAGRHGVD